MVSNSKDLPRRNYIEFDGRLVNIEIEHTTFGGELNLLPPLFILPNAIVNE